MTLGEMCGYIEETKNSFPDLKMVVFTGGECTLLGDDLFKAISFAKTLDFKTRIVTNGHWAMTDCNRVSMIQSLADAGLNEINFSTGDEHARFVNHSKIADAMALCAKYPFDSVAVNIEDSPGNKLTSQVFKSEKSFESLSEKEKNKIIFLQSSWIRFREGKANVAGDNHEKKIHIDSGRGCSAILDSININPNGQFLSCCGLSCEYSPFLKLGSLRTNTIKQLHDERFEDIMKLWIFTEGPMRILEKITGENVDGHKHMCEYCLSLLTDVEKIKRILTLTSKDISQIFLNYNLKINRQKQ